MQSDLKIVKDEHCYFICRMEDACKLVNSYLRTKIAELYFTQSCCYYIKQRYNNRDILSWHHILLRQRVQRDTDVMTIRMFLFKYDSFKTLNN